MTCVYNSHVDIYPIILGLWEYCNLTLSCRTQYENESRSIVFARKMFAFAESWH